jgi:hypothetical protein
MIGPDKNGLLWIRDLSGGLNDTDAPQDIADNQCQIAQNGAKAARTPST